MKKIIYLTAFALIISACGKDNATPKYIDNNLIGIWELTECYENYNKSGEIDIDNAKNFTKINAQLTVTFSSDTTCGFTYTFSDGDYAQYNYHIKSNNIVLSKLCEMQLHNDGYIFYHIQDEIIYKIYDKEIIIANKYIWGSEYRIYYSFYKRKS
jgi:hypothetical protein